MSSNKSSREPGTVPAFAWLLAALAGVTYASWVLQFVINPGLDPVNGYVSELSASDQPFHYLFAAGDFTAGLLTIVVVSLVLRSVRPRGWSLVGWLALVMFGVFSIADALFAMDCAPNSDTTCALRERAGRVSFAHQFHSVTSVCVVMAGIISLIALTIVARRDPGRRRWPVIARWSWILLVLEIVTAAATLPLMYFGVLLGVMERAQVAIISIWLFVIAGQLFRDRLRLAAPATPPVRGAPVRKTPEPVPGTPGSSAPPQRAMPGGRAKPRRDADDGTWGEAART